MLYEYNQVQYGSQVNKIWHIHGEARKHSSMIFGHFYYGMVLQDIIKYVKDKKNDYAVDQKNGRESAIKSWIDAFILGDIYLIGTRLELSEIDLWWLINRKKREKNASHGNIYFYEPKFEPEEEGFVDERLELIKVFAREVKDMGITIPKIDKDDPLAEEKRGEKFREFYRKAVNDISEKIAAKKS